MKKWNKGLFGVIVSFGILFLSACGTENSKTLYEQFKVVYEWNNAEMSIQPTKEIMQGEWNQDGVEDMLRIGKKELEGTEYIERFELILSGINTPYILENVEYEFLDIIPGNFDSDMDVEIVLLFDTRYVGAEGGLAIQLLDYTNESYTNVFSDFFLGKEYVYDSAMGLVTGFYSIEVLENKKENFIKIKQYIAGEDMMDHVGDMVSIWQYQNGDFIQLQEYLEIN